MLDSLTFVLILRLVTVKLRILHTGLILMDPDLVTDEVILEGTGSREQWEGGWPVVTVLEVEKGTMRKLARLIDLPHAKRS